MINQCKYPTDSTVFFSPAMSTMWHLMRRAGSKSITWWLRHAVYLEWASMRKSEGVRLPYLDCSESHKSTCLQREPRRGGWAEQDRTGRHKVSLQLFLVKRGHRLSAVNRRRRRALQRPHNAVFMPPPVYRIFPTVRQATPRRGGETRGPAPGPAFTARRLPGNFPSPWRGVMHTVCVRDIGQEGVWVSYPNNW